MTFKACAEEYHAANVTRWTNAKHRTEWISALRRFAFPVIGHLSVDIIDSGHVHKVLAPLVTEKAGHRRAPAGPHRDRARLCQGGGPPHRRQSRRTKTIIAHMLPLQSEKSAVCRISPRCRSPSCPR